MIGDVIASEMIRFKDPHTGAEITQYTTGDKRVTSRTLYFTNRPFVMDGRGAVILSNRSGSNQMYLLELDTGKMVQVTDTDLQGNVSTCVHPRRPELYFRNSTALCRVNLETLKTEELVRPAPGFGIGILNMNCPPWLCWESPEKRTGATRIRAGDDGALFTPGRVPGGELWYMRPLTLLYRFDIDNDKLECVWSEHKSLSHVQMSPVDPNLMIYSSNFLYDADDRCWYLDLDSLKRRRRRMFPESDTARAGHECFTRRGNVYAQWLEGDLREGKPKKLYHAFRKTAGCHVSDIQNAPFVRYELPEVNDYLHHHFTMSEDETWGLHDRFPAAATPKENENFMSVFRHQDEHPQTVCERVCYTGGKDGGDRIGLGPEAHLDAKDEFALYTSFHTGNETVCRVDVRPFVEKLFR